MRTMWSLNDINYAYNSGIILLFSSMPIILIGKGLETSCNHRQSNPIINWFTQLCDYYYSWEVESHFKGRKSWLHPCFICKCKLLITLCINVWVHVYMWCLCVCTCYIYVCAYVLLLLYVCVCYNCLETKAFMSKLPAMWWVWVTEKQ